MAKKTIFHKEMWKINSIKTMNHDSPRKRNISISDDSSISYDRNWEEEKTQRGGINNIDHFVSKT